MTSLDAKILLAIHFFVLNYYMRLGKLTIFFGAWSGYVLFAVFLALGVWFWRKKKNWRFFAEGLISAIFARLVLTEAVRYFWPVPRPFMKLRINSLFGLSRLDSILPSGIDGSFPSGHAAFFFALAASVFFSSRAWGWVFLAAAFLMGLGRIGAAVHWPSDILAGAFIGIASAFLFHRINKIFSGK